MSYIEEVQRREVVAADAAREPRANLLEEVSPP